VLGQAPPTRSGSSRSLCETLMPFPETPRVLYAINPLDKVLCQLRFPTILRVATELPAAFQERVRDRYPLFQQRALSLPVPVPAQIAQQLGLQLNLGTGEVAYEFSTEDGLWEVSLTKDFLALSTHEYQRWEGFKEYLALPLAALLDVYAPAFFSRIGLRYNDVIVRSKLGLEVVEWGELLQPHAAAELGEPGVAACVENSHRRVDIRLADGRGKVRLQHGFVDHAETREVCYLIDSDFYTDERTETQDAGAVLDNFNRQSGRLFRWCITSRLHEAMGPRDLASLG